MLQKLQTIDLVVMSIIIRALDVSMVHVAYLEKVTQCHKINMNLAEVRKHGQ